MHAQVIPRETKLEKKRKNEPIFRCGSMALKRDGYLRVIVLVCICKAEHFFMTIHKYQNYPGTIKSL
jgi:hypothetical protein